MKHFFNITVGNMEKQFQLVYNLYKNSLDNILDNNVDNIMTKIVYIKPKS